MDLQVIEQREVLNKDFKIYGDKENPIFLAKDVASWIEHSRTSEMLKGIDEEEKLMQTIFASGQNREMWFLTEDGLYEVLMQSRKPIAKAFKKEIKKILKQIRNTGGYIPVKEEESDQDILAKALMIAQNTLNRKDKILEDQKKEIAAKTKEIKSIEPKAKVYDDIINSNKLFTVTQIAQDFGMTAIELNKTLKELGVQYKQGGPNGGWILYQKYKSKGYVHSEIVDIGKGRTKLNTKWTIKGKLFIHDFLSENGIYSVIERYKHD